ncbi:efflux RND transporter periplasmic adaptor subunit [Oleidesulfovibrio sp.]|uniref:efflux RND transporter periplasmic adaptor subunit n=1 Tax=Oleidesulfovibrio sp. TaxID=2909707 RepID=UPI003A88BC49
MTASGTKARVLPSSLHILITFSLCILLLAGCSENKEEVAPPPVKPVKVMTIGGSDKGIKRVFPGKVVAGEKVELGFRVTGQLTEFSVKESQHVKEGQVVAELDKNDFYTKVRNIESQLGGAKASLNEATLNFKRMETLLKQDTISRADYDKARAAMDNANAKVLSLAQQLKQANQDLEYTTLRAPFSGVIAKKYVKNYEQVQAQQPVLRLENTDRLDIEVETPEFVIVQLRNQNRAKMPPPIARFSAFPGRSFELSLKEYQTSANPQTQTYTVTLTMESPEDIELLPGMTADVEGTLPFGDDIQATSLPVSAVVGGETDEPYIWQLDKESMTVSRKPVSVGAVHQDKITIMEGLEPGMTVVVAGANYLHEGQKVRILEGKIGGGK